MSKFIIPPSSFKVKNDQNNKNNRKTNEGAYFYVITFVIKLYQIFVIPYVIKLYFKPLPASLGLSRQESIGPPPPSSQVLV